MGYKIELNKLKELIEREIFLRGNRYGRAY